MTKIGAGTPERAAAEAGAWRCEVCGTTLGGKTRRGRPRRHCSAACKQTAYRQRHAPGEQQLRDELAVALDDVRAGLRDGALAADLSGLGLTGEQLRVAHRQAVAAAAAVRALAGLRALARLVPPDTDPAEAPPVPPAVVDVEPGPAPAAEVAPVPVEDPPPMPDPAPAPEPNARAAQRKPAARPARSARREPALPGPVEVPENVDARRRRAAEAWNGLNDRQRLYLATIYDADQAAERNARGSATDWAPSRPASEWRWLLYTVASADSGHTTIQSTISYRGHLDPGAGSTLAALASRGLVERQDDWIQSLFGTTPCVRVRLTPAGRAAARAGRGITAPVSPPRGLVSEWVWSTLSAFYRADLLGGFSSERGGLREPSWNACLQLYNRRGEEWIEDGPRGTHRINDAGREHYETHWACYRELHPGVDAPEPAHRLDGAHTGLVDHKAPPRPRGLLGRTAWRALDHLVGCHAAGENHLRYYLFGSHRDETRPPAIADLPHGSSRAALAHVARSAGALDRLLDHRGVALAAEREVTDLNGRRYSVDDGARLWIVWPTEEGLAHHAEHAETYRELYAD
ncbi:hypothetical protein [Embleya hyalina]|uniref:hypothetical protein n=1 Tax=Embleya hyalina TaxID=516124 RepID=UPI000F848EA6|nr:hypothetical protein [Embleya hyalina]